MRPTIINGVRGVGFLSDKGAYGVYNLVPSPRHQQTHAKALQTIRFVVLITLKAIPSSLQHFDNTLNAFQNHRWMSLISQGFMNPTNLTDLVEDFRDRLEDFVEYFGQLTKTALGGEKENTGNVVDRARLQLESARLTAGRIRRTYIVDVPKDRWYEEG